MKITHKPYKRQPKLVGCSWEEMCEGPDGRYQCVNKYTGRTLHLFVKKKSVIWYTYLTNKAASGWSSGEYLFNYLGPGTHHTK